MKILVVDDKPDNVELLYQILEDDYDVISAYNGADCIKLAKEQQPDLIILDVMIPILDGYDVLEILQEDESTSNIPVIFLTASYKDTDRIVKGLESGAFDYITKPINDEVLLAKVNSVTRIKKAEDEVKRKNVELERANEKLMELDCLKSTFIASMSHELMTPLNSIIGFTSTILKGMAGEINEEQRKQLAMVKDSGNHLLALINDIIDLSKIEAGKVEVSNEEFDMSLLVKEMKDFFAIAVKEKNLKISIDMSERLTIIDDERKIKQILINLLANAIKFSDRGEVEIKVLTKDKMVEIAVTDSGIGIKEEDMEKLFKSFSKVSTGNGQRGGTGLGLYLSKKIAALLGGEIKVESEYGKGSTFTLTLPLKCTDLRLSCG